VNPLPHQIAAHFVAKIVIIIAEGRPVESETPAAAAESTTTKSAAVKPTAVKAASVESSSTPMAATRKRSRRQGKAGQRNGEYSYDHFTRHDFSPSSSCSLMRPWKCPRLMKINPEINSR
jgi:hypothetical protein